MKRILFHIPFKINPNKSSGTNIRPLKMLDAFQKNGFEVTAIMGNGKERKQIIQKVKKAINNGVKYDFLYSESSTLPTLLTEDHHLPTYPFLDFGFFKFCKQNKIKIGLFYRDIFWNFEAYSLKGMKALYTKLMYNYDLNKYNDLVDVLFLPSLEMLQYIPKKMDCLVTALPPGHDLPDISVKEKVSDSLELLYVGGVSNHYQMEALFEAVHKITKVHLTICTRKEEWETAKMGSYAKYVDASNISIVHKQNHQLQSFYEKADIAMLFVEPFDYWQFAVPVKLYEYIGNKKPIIASANCYTGSFVAEENIGWTIPYSAEALENLLNNIKKDPAQLASKIENLQHVYVENSWIARAEKVSFTLSKKVT